MPAERHSAGSTGGTARRYHAPMRNANIIALSFFLSPLACGEDAPTRPEDGTVEVWDACVWDGQMTSSLCAPELACAWHGICVPKCESLDECMFDGFLSECNISNEQNVCMVRCSEDNECPQTGGAQLHCLDFYCVREV